MCGKKILIFKKQYVYLNIRECDVRKKLKTDLEMQKFFETVEVKGISDIKLLIKKDKKFRSNKT